MPLSYQFYVKKKREKIQKQRTEKGAGVNRSSRFFTILGDKDTTWNERHEGTKERYTAREREETNERPMAKRETAQRWTSRGGEFIAFADIAAIRVHYGLQWRDGGKRALVPITCRPARTAIGLIVRGQE